MADPTAFVLAPPQQLFIRKFQLLVIDTSGGNVFDSDQSMPTYQQETNTSIGPGVQSGTGNALYPAIDVSSLRFTFNINRELAQPTGQTAEITIYNLNKSDESNILANASDLILSAGYANGPYGVIYQGRIIQRIRGKEDGTTYFLRCVCITGDQALNTNLANMVIPSGTSQEDQIKMIARSSNIPFDVKVDPNLPNGKVVSQRGKTIFGKPVATLRSLALNNQAAYYYNQNAFNITNLNATTPPNAVPSLNAYTGMIGIPQQTEAGVMVRSLINPQFDLNTWVKLDNSTIIQFQISVPNSPLQFLLDADGLYRIIGMSIYGDTRGNDWYTDLQTIGQQGFTVNTLTNATQTAF